MNGIKTNNSQALCWTTAAAVTLGSSFTPVSYATVFVASASCVGWSPADRHSSFDAIYDGDDDAWDSMVESFAAESDATDFHAEWRNR